MSERHLIVQSKYVDRRRGDRKRRRVEKRQPISDVLTCVAVNVSKLCVKLSEYVSKMLVSGLIATRRRIDVDTDSIRCRCGDWSR